MGGLDVQQGKARHFSVIIVIINIVIIVNSNADTTSTLISTNVAAEICKAINSLKLLHQSLIE